MSYVFARRKRGRTSFRTGTQSNFEPFENLPSLGAFNDGGGWYADYRSNSGGLSGFGFAAMGVGVGPIE